MATGGGKVSTSGASSGSKTSTTSTTASKSSTTTTAPKTSTTTTTTKTATSSNLAVPVTRADGKTVWVAPGGSDYKREVAKGATPGASTSSTSTTTTAPKTIGGGGGGTSTTTAPIVDPNKYFKGAEGTAVKDPKTGIVTYGGTEGHRLGDMPKSTRVQTWTSGGVKIADTERVFASVGPTMDPWLTPQEVLARQDQTEAVKAEAKAKLAAMGTYYIPTPVGAQIQVEASRYEQAVKTGKEKEYAPLELFPEQKAYAKTWEDTASIILESLKQSKAKTDAASALQLPKPEKNIFVTTSIGEAMANLKASAPQTSSIEGMSIPVIFEQKTPLLSSRQEESTKASTFMDYVKEQQGMSIAPKKTLFESGEQKIKEVITTSAPFKVISTTLSNLPEIGEKYITAKEKEKQFLQEKALSDIKIGTQELAKEIATYNAQASQFKQGYGGLDTATALSESRALTNEYNVLSNKLQFLPTTIKESLLVSPSTKTSDDIFMRAGVPIGETDTKKIAGTITEYAPLELVLPTLQDLDVQQQFREQGGFLGRTKLYDQADTRRETDRLIKAQESTMKVAEGVAAEKFGKLTKEAGTLISDIVAANKVIEDRNAELDKDLAKLQKEENDAKWQMVFDAKMTQEQKEKLVSDIEEKYNQYNKKVVDAEAFALQNQEKAKRLTAIDEDIKKSNAALFKWSDNANIKLAESLRIVSETDPFRQREREQTEALREIAAAPSSFFGIGPEKISYGFKGALLIKGGIDKFSLGLFRTVVRDPAYTIAKPFTIVKEDVQKGDILKYFTPTGAAAEVIGRTFYDWKEKDPYWDTRAVSGGVQLATLGLAGWLSTAKGGTTAAIEGGGRALTWAQKLRESAILSPKIFSPVRKALMPAALKTGGKVFTWGALVGLPVFSSGQEYIAARKEYTAAQKAAAERAAQGYSYDERLLPEKPTILTSFVSPLLETGGEVTGYVLPSTMMMIRPPTIQTARVETISTVPRIKVVGKAGPKTLKESIKAARVRIQPQSVEDIVKGRVRGVTPSTKEINAAIERLKQVQKLPGDAEVTAAGTLQSQPFAKYWELPVGKGYPVIGRYKTTGGQFEWMLGAPKASKVTGVYKEAVASVGGKGEVLIGQKTYTVRTTPQGYNRYVNYKGKKYFVTEPKLGSSEMPKVTIGKITYEVGMPVIENPQTGSQYIVRDIYQSAGYYSPEQLKFQREMFETMLPLGRFKGSATFDKILKQGTKTLTADEAKKLINYGLKKGYIFRGSAVGYDIDPKLYYQYMGNKVPTDIDANTFFRWLQVEKQKDEMAGIIISGRPDIAGKTLVATPQQPGGLFRRIPDKTISTATGATSTKMKLEPILDIKSPEILPESPVPPTGLAWQRFGKSPITIDVGGEKALAIRQGEQLLNELDASVRTRWFTAGPGPATAKDAKHIASLFMQAEDIMTKTKNVAGLAKLKELKAVYNQRIFAGPINYPKTQPFSYDIYKGVTLGGAEYGAKAFVPLRGLGGPGASVQTAKTITESFAAPKPSMLGYGSFSTIEAPLGLGALSALSATSGSVITSPKLSYPSSKTSLSSAFSGLSGVSSISALSEPSKPSSGESKGSEGSSGSAGSSETSSYSEYTSYTTSGGGIGPLAPIFGLPLMGGGAGSLLSPTATYKPRRGVRTWSIINPLARLEEPFFAKQYAKERGINIGIASSKFNVMGMGLKQGRFL